MAGKAPRKKMFVDDLARQRHSAHRRALMRAEKDRKVRELDRGRSELERAALRIKERETFRRTNMVNLGLASRLDAVGKSMGVNVRTTIRPGIQVSASTVIGKSIEVVHDRRLIASVYDDSGYEHNPITDALLQEIAIETRGFYYHEVGHNLFTTPLLDLIKLAVAEGFSPDGLYVFENPAYVAGGSNGSRHQYEHSAYFHRAWNILEDQRMEKAMIRYSPVLKNYLTVMVMRNMIDTNVFSSWLLLAGRKYLPDAVREQARSSWDTHGRYDMRCDADAACIEHMIDRYMAADTALEMVECIMRFAEALGNNVVMSGTGSHRGLGSKIDNSETSQMKEEERSQSQEQRSEDAREQIKNSAEPEEEESNEEQGAATGPNDSSEESQEEGSESRISRMSQKESSQKMIENALKEAIDGLRNEQTVTEDVTSMNSAYATDESLLPKYHRITESTDSEMIAKARLLAEDIEQSFRVATQQAAPRWETQQRRGVLEPIRYLTRQPGDMEFFRDYMDHGDPGADIAVSVFLDISGSMVGSEDALGAAAWSMKTACDRLNIECDITLFDDSAYCLWATSDRPDEVPVIECAGGTTPDPAFRAVLNDERDKRQHLVLVMTDGEWSHGSSMANYKMRNSYGVLFFYDSYADPKQDVDMAHRLGADEGFRIDDLNQMPVALESLLLSMV